MTQVSKNSNKEYATADKKTGDREGQGNHTGHVHDALNAGNLRIYQHWLTGRWGTLAISGLLFSAALFLNLRHLSTPSIWFDEAFSVELARQPLPLLWHIIFGPEPNMELYYLFLHFWLGLTQSLGLLPTEFVVRFPSTIFAALSTVVVFWLGKHSINLFAGVLASALYMLNYLQLVYAQQTRSYSLQLLFICIAWYALFNALLSPRRENKAHSSMHITKGRAWWIVYVLAMALAVYAHLFSLLILLSQGTAVVLLLLIPNVWRAAIRAQFRACVISLFALVVLILPMLIESRQGAKTGWLPVPHKNDIIYLSQMLSGFSRTYLLMIALFCIVGVLLVAIASLFSVLKHRQRHTQTEQSQIPAPDSSPDASSSGAMKGNEIETGLQLFPVMLSLLCWLVLPPVVSYIVSQGSLRLFSSRYLVVIVPALCLLMALGASTLRWPATATKGRGLGEQGNGPSKRPIASLAEWALPVLFALLLLVLALPAVPQYYRSAQVEDWNTVSHWIIQHYQQDDGLVCYDNDVQQGCQISVEYYLHAYPSAAHFTSDTPGAFSWSRFAASNPDAAVDPNTLAAYGRKHTRIFFIVGRLPDDRAAAKAKAAQQWLDSHFKLVNTFEKPTVTVRLYEVAGV